MQRLKRNRFILLLLCFFLAACQQDKVNPTNLEPELVDVDDLNNLDIEDMPAPELISEKEEADLAKSNSTLLTFSDQAALNLIPDYNSTFVPWPGYVQSLGQGTFAYAWMSYGPKNGLIPHTDMGKHYHIVWDNFCFNAQEGISGYEASGYCYPINLFPLTAINRYHTAMFGNEWFAVYAQKSGQGRRNFNLERIRIKGNVPVNIWIKKANGRWRRWKNLGAANYNFAPYAQNIQEFHVRASSKSAADKYSIDDIRLSL